MFIGKYTNEYNDIYWAEGDSINEILLEFEGIDGAPVRAGKVIFYKAEYIKVTVKTEYIIQPAD